MDTGWFPVVILKMKVKALMVMVTLLLMEAGVGAGVGPCGLALVCLGLDVVDVCGWWDGTHAGLLCVGGCVLWMQRYEDVVTHLVVRLREIDVYGVGHMVLCSFVLR